MPGSVEIEDDETQAGFLVIRQLLAAEDAERQREPGRAARGLTNVVTSRVQTLRASMSCRTTAEAVHKDGRGRSILSGNGLHPVGLMSLRRNGAEPDIYRCVRVHDDDPFLAADAGELLVGLQHRASLIVIDDERPESPSPGCWAANESCRSCCHPAACLRSRRTRRRIVSRCRPSSRPLPE